MNNLEPFGTSLLSRCLYFYGVKKQIGKLILKRTSESKRKKKGFTFNNAQYVGLIGLIVKESDYSELVQRMFDIRANHGVRNVIGIGFVDYSRKKTPVFVKEQKDLILFFKDDVNWKNMPSALIIDQCKQKFDLLLDVFGEECTPLEFLWRFIPASLKVSHETYPTADFADLLAQVIPENKKVVFKAYEELLTKYDLK